MFKAGKSFSQPFIPSNGEVCNRGDGGASFPVDNPSTHASSASTLFLASGKTDVTALMAAVGGEQLQYIEFNSVRRALEARKRWPLLRLVSELLAKPEKSVDVAKPVIMHKDGVAI